MKCENCPYYYAIGFGYKECQFVGDFGAPCEEPDPEPVHYTVQYNGCLFVGDKCSGINSLDTDSWEEAIALYNRLKSDGIDVWLNDNLYDVTLHNDEWN